MSHKNESEIYPFPTFLTFLRPTWSLVTDLLLESDRLMDVARKDRKSKLPASLLNNIVPITKQTQKPDHSGKVYHHDLKNLKKKW